MENVIATENKPIKLWLSDIEDGALQQAKDLANLPFVYKHIAIMPDSHQGYGMPIGGVMATEGVIVPNAVGVDIGCGMAVSKTSIVDVDTETIKRVMQRIRDLIPVGFNHQKEAQVWSGFDEAPDLKIIQQELNSARSQLGTLGGGNHFIEIQKGDDGHIWIMLHSGSRNFGLKAAAEYHKKAQYLCDKWFSKIPNKDLAFLPIESNEGNDYYYAMNYCLRFAKESRSLMMNRVIESLFLETGATVLWELDIHHNYAAFEHHFGKDVLVHRKGATRARLGEPGIIPGSMGTNSYITEGLGNEDSFMSSSHGAGRRMGRNDAVRTLSLADEQEKMAGIVHGLRTAKDLDESPGAYKDIDVVMENQKDLVKILYKLTPLASIKG
jgi:tRNA-splicing ligase RtcB